MQMLVGVNFGCLVECMVIIVLGAWYRRECDRGCSEKDSSGVR